MSGNSVRMEDEDEEGVGDRSMEDSGLEVSAAARSFRVRSIASACLLSVLASDRSAVLGGLATGLGPGRLKAVSVVDPWRRLGCGENALREDRALGEVLDGRGAGCRVGLYGKEVRGVVGERGRSACAPESSPSAEKACVWCTVPTSSVSGD